MEEFALSEKRLRQLRKEKRITHRLEGKEYCYQTQSLIDYCRGNMTIAISKPQNEDEKLMLLTREVIRKEREKEVMEKEKSKQGGDNV